MNTFQYDYLVEDTFINYYLSGGIEYYLLPIHISGLPFLNVIRFSLVKDIY
jgi:hypothetical protein